MIIAMIMAVFVCCMGAARGVDLGVDVNYDYFQDDADLPGLEAVPGQPAYKPGELLVRFAPKPDGKQRTLAGKNDILASIYGGNIKHSYKLVPGLTVVKLPPGKSVEDVLTTFNKSSGILYAEPNYRFKAISTFPDDPNFAQLWGMHNTGQTGGTEDADIDAPEAWDIANEANDIIVAVLDSGVDFTHPDLAGNMWVNEAELNGIPGVDDDNNVFVDDIYGYDFYNNDGNPMDDMLHGTHCAGIIGAVGNNAEGVAGVCWNVRIMALKWLNVFGIGWASEAIDSIEYAVEMGADVLSNSWCGPNSSSLKDAIEAADANGVLFVAAAGNYQMGSYWYDNDVTPVYPASYDCNNIISVMATDHNDNRSSFSHYGANSVDLGAPGSNILSTFPTHETYLIMDENLSTYYETISGTSMATPHVAGACALVWGMNPALSHLEVKDIILDTVDVTDPPLECVSEGRLNLYYALTEAGTQAGKQAVILNKVDDVNGPVLPDDYITYTISFENSVRGPNDANFPFGDLTNVTIVDYLPVEVDYNNPYDPNYDPNEHTYTWNIGTLQEDDSDSVELTVVVNNLAEPLGKITNVCVIEANEIWPKTMVGNTDVNFWDPGIIYVDRDAVAGDNTGMTWEHAYTDLQDALDRASNCCANDIWVAEGTYKPTKKGFPEISFELFDGVAIYGGFDATETARSQRDWVNNVTILSGDIDNDGVLDDENSYHVVKCEDVNTAILDGFTITAGNADGYTVPDHQGGGLYCIDSSNLTVRNCVISQNRAHSINYCGGGIYFKDSNNLTLTDCNISDNNAWLGGALYNESSETNINNCIFSINSSHFGGGMFNFYEPSPKVSNCTFKDNTIHHSSSTYGGGIFNYEVSPTIINCTFSGNSATTTGGAACGGAIANWDDSDPNVTNCTFGNNSADYGGGMYSYGCSPAVTNCIFWGNDAGSSGDEIYNDFSDPNISYCDIEGCKPGGVWNPNFGNDLGGNIDQDPCFEDADANDFHLDTNSPCIDAGDPNGDYSGEFDIDDQPRVMVSEVDMGADEAAYLPTDHPDYNEWVDVGKPACWCYQRQCHGDADGRAYGEYNYWVSIYDLEVLQAAWCKTFEEIDGETITVGGKEVELICADFDHAPYGKFNYRVSIPDLDILKEYWGGDPNSKTPDPNCFCD